MRFLCVAMSIVLLTGCMSSARTPEQKQADATRRAAITSYAQNQTLIQQTVQDAYRGEAYQHIDDLTEAKLKEKATADGKVSLLDVKDVMAKREVARGSVDVQISKLTTAIANANKDLIAFLKLDDLMEQWIDAGISTQAANGAIQSIISIFQQRTSTPSPGLGK
jgi:hypothetical protein